MDEAQARRELRTALKGRRRQQVGALVLVGAVLLGSLAGAIAETVVAGRISSMAALPLIYAAMMVVLGRLYFRRVDTEAELVRCRVVHPYGVGGVGLRIRRPDGALLAITLSDDKGAVVNEGDDVWCLDPKEGRPLAGVRWNPVLRRGEVVMGIGRSRLVVPPGALPAALARDFTAHGPHDTPQDRLHDEDPGSSPLGSSPLGSAPLGSAPLGSSHAGSSHPGPVGRPSPRPLAIKPLGPPPPTPPDGIDEHQARAALAAPPPSRLPSRRTSPTPPDVPLQVVTIVSAPPSPYAPRRAQITVRRATGESFSWETTLQRWPTAGSTAWATPLADGQPARLVLPTPAGDVVVAEPHGPARPAASAEPPQHG